MFVHMFVLVRGIMKLSLFCGGDNGDNDDDNACMDYDEEVAAAADDEYYDLCEYYDDEDDYDDHCLFCYVIQGSALGIPKSNCDDGYKGTVIEECEGDTSCLRDAAYFLQLMAQAHVYEANSPDACATSCVRDFIVGIDE